MVPMIILETEEEMAETKMATKTVISISVVIAPVTMIKVEDIADDDIEVEAEQPDIHYYQVHEEELKRQLRQKLEYKHQC